MFHPQLGRFCGRDPIQSLESKWNSYAYVGGKPTTAMDPSGEACIVYYNCELIRVRKEGMFIKECVYACTESKKARKPIPGAGDTDCHDPRIPVFFTLPRPTLRYVCSCRSKLRDYGKMWDDWGVFFDCDKDECIQQAKDAASKAKNTTCKFLPPAAKQACIAWWTTWEQGMIALCSKCTGKKK